MHSKKLLLTKYLIEEVRTQVNPKRQAWEGNRQQLTAADCNAIAGENKAHPPFVDIMISLILY